MRPRSLPRLLGYGLVSALVVSGAGCSTPPYAHDEAVHARLKSAKANFSKATNDNAGIWTTVRENLDKAAAIEARAIQQAQETRFKTSLANAQGWDWSTLIADARTAKADAEKELKDVQDKMAQLTAEIDTLEKEAGSETAVATPENTDLSADLRAALNSASEWADKAKDVQDKLPKYLDKAEKQIVPKLKAFVDADGLATAVDALRKATDSDLIADVQAALKTAGGLSGDAEARAKVALPAKFSEAMKKYTGLDIKSVGELEQLATLKDSGIREIALSAEQEHRRTLAQLRRARMEAAAEKLRLYAVHLAILGESVKSADRLAGLSDEEAEELGLTGNVVASLEGDVLAFASSRNAQDRGDRRDSLEEKLSRLTSHAERIGTISRWSVLQRHQLAVLDSRESAQREQIAAESRERLVALGLDGAIAFAEGGITEEQVANWLRAAQTVAVTFIAFKVD